MAFNGILPDSALDECAGIVGKTGTGKSYLAKGLVERMLAAKNRVCILDPTGAWWGLKSNAAGDGPGFQVAIFGGEHADLPITVEQAEPLAHLIATSNLPTVIDMSDFTTSERRRFATRFLDALYHKNREALHLIVDEADEFAPQRPGPDQTTLLNRMDQIVRRGRVKGFRVMLITQRPAVLSKDVLSMAALLIAMKLTSPQDRNAISAYLEGQAEQAQRKLIVDGLPRLERGQGWVWWPEGAILEQATFPKITTFDSSKTPEAGQAVMLPTGLAEVDLSEFKAALATPEAVEKKTGASPAQLKSEYDRGHAAGYEVGHNAGYWKGMQFMGRDAAASVKAALAQIEAAFPTDEQLTRLSKQPAPAQAPAVPISAATPCAAPSARPAPSRPQAADGAVSKPHQRVLDVLAWWKAAGFDPVERRRACVLAGYSPKASTFGVYISDLTRNGFVSAPAPGMLALTNAGAGLANAPDFSGTDALLNAARNLLSAAELKVFDAIVRAGDWMGRGDLADAVGLSRTASTLGVYLSKIGGFGFIETRPSQVRIADWLLAAGTP